MTIKITHKLLLTNGKVDRNSNTIHFHNNHSELDNGYHEKQLHTILLG